MIDKGNSYYAKVDLRSLQLQNKETPPVVPSRQLWSELNMWVFLDLPGECSKNLI